MPLELLPPSWGVRPILFWIGDTPVPSYEVCLLLAIAVAITSYLAAASRHAELRERSGYLLIAALIGGTIGAKAPVLLLHHREMAAQHSAFAFLSGRTIAGGLIGGTLAVIAVRRRLGIVGSTGNLFAPGLALAHAIGRIGCLLRGCCYGIPTHAAWGVDFGDGVPRHPTQLYEAAVALALFAWLVCAASRNPPPGALFRTFMLVTFGFRFLVEFMRTDPPVAAGLTLAQWACAIVIAAYLLADRRRQANTRGDPARRAST